MFNSDDVGKGWDGNYRGAPIEMGTYYYLVKATVDVPGAKSEVIKGDVIMIR